MENVVIFIVGMVAGCILNAIVMMSRRFGTLAIDMKRDRMRLILDGVVDFDNLTKGTKWVMLKIDTEADLPSQENQVP